MLSKSALFFALGAFFTASALAQQVGLGDADAVEAIVAKTRPDAALVRGLLEYRRNRLSAVAG